MGEVDDVAPLGLDQSPIQGSGHSVVNSGCFHPGLGAKSGTRRPSKWLPPVAHHRLQPTPELPMTSIERSTPVRGVVRSRRRGAALELKNAPPYRSPPCGDSSPPQAPVGPRLYCQRRSRKGVEKSQTRRLNSAVSRATYVLYQAALSPRVPLPPAARGCRMQSGWLSLQKSRLRPAYAREREKPAAYGESERRHRQLGRRESTALARPSRWATASSFRGNLLPNAHLGWLLEGFVVHRRVRVRPRPWVRGPKLRPVYHQTRRPDSALGGGNRPHSRGRRGDPTIGARPRHHRRGC